MGRQVVSLQHDMIGSTENTGWGVKLEKRQDCFSVSKQETYSRSDERECSPKFKAVTEETEVG